MWSVGPSNGISLDNLNTRSASYGFNSFGTDPGQLQQAPIPAPPNRRHTFPIEFSGKIAKPEREYVLSFCVLYSNRGF